MVVTPNEASVPFPFREIEMHQKPPLLTQRVFIIRSSEGTGQRRDAVYCLRVGGAPFHDIQRVVTGEGIQANASVNPMTLVLSVASAPN